MFNAAQFIGSGFEYTIRGSGNYFKVSIMGRRLPGWFKSLEAAHERVMRSFKIYLKSK